MSDTANKTAIQIALPLPMPVVGTLMNLIGAAYPDAEMGNSASGLKFLIPSNAVPQELPTDFTPVPSGEDDVNVTSLGPDGIAINTPAELASVCLHIMKATFEEFPDAKNYLETQCYDREEGKSYVLTFRRAECNTPHQMRQIAEKERDDAKAELKKVQKELAKTKDKLKALLKESGKKETVHTAKEIHALPEGSILMHNGTIAVKNEDRVWNLPNLSPRSSEDLSRFSNSWVVLLRGSK